jgi:hypothetical protein
MGIVHTHRGHLASAAILAVLMALAVIVTLGLAASPASASTTFTLCSPCHNYSFNDAFHNAGGHPGAGCATCHPNGTSQPPVTSACAASACHISAAAIISAQPANHTATTCGTASAACHGVTATAPTVTSFSPASGPVATTVTLTGTGFTGTTKVTFNGISAPTFAVVSAIKLTVKVPVGATTGPIAVTNPTGTGTSATSFTVTLPAKPKIVKLSPTAAKRGVIVAITGTGFGAKRATTSSVKFGLTKATKYVSWTSTKIKVRVPARAKFGLLKVKVTTAAGTSNGVNFRVKR